MKGRFVCWLTGCHRWTTRWICDRCGVTREELHNQTVIRTGRGMILLPTNVEDIDDHVGGVPCA